MIKGGQTKNKICNKPWFVFIMGICTLGIYPVFYYLFAKFGIEKVGKIFIIISLVTILYYTVLPKSEVEITFDTIRTENVVMLPAEPAIASKIDEDSPYTKSFTKGKYLVGTGETWLVEGLYEVDSSQTDEFCKKSSSEELETSEEIKVFGDDCLVSDIYFRKGDTIEVLKDDVTFVKKVPRYYVMTKAIPPKPVRESIEAVEFNEYSLVDNDEVCYIDDVETSCIDLSSYYTLKAKEGKVIQTTTERVKTLGNIQTCYSNDVKVDNCYDLKMDRLLIPVLIKYTLKL